MGWRNHADRVAWKRRIHKEYRTRLIETYSRQQSDGTLRESLHAGLEAVGVKLERVDREELASRQISTLGRLLATFLTHAKGASLGDRELSARGRDSRDPKSAARFLSIYRHVREEYEELLAAEKSIDFHDLINRAADLIEENVPRGRLDRRFKHGIGQGRRERDYSPQGDGPRPPSLPRVESVEVSLPPEDAVVRSDQAVPSQGCCNDDAVGGVGVKAGQCIGADSNLAVNGDLLQPLAEQLPTPQPDILRKVQSPLAL